MKLLLLSIFLSSVFGDGRLGLKEYLDSFDDETEATTYEVNIEHSTTYLFGKGLFPPISNVARRAKININATCGQLRPERYCRLEELNCGVCDAGSLSNSHQPRHAIDDSDETWWQSPTLSNGYDYHWVDIHIDLGQIYYVSEVLIKAAISPRPGNWILERSIDGETYKAWQYYASSDQQCRETYGIEPTTGKPTYNGDNDVICTAFYSKLNPTSGGEILTSLVTGRPGARGPSAELRRFMEARHVKLRFQRMQTLSGDENNVDPSVLQKYFYSIKDISIQGQCVCNGHAEECPLDESTGVSRCRCAHNTCGDHCEKCCPLYNQLPWRPGTSLDAAQCQKCQCNGHASECFYEDAVARRRDSVDIEGHYKGGGVCINCQHDTTGNNCERCADSYYRPHGVALDDLRPCRPCNCNTIGSLGSCVSDDSRINEGYIPGNCICKAGFTGPRCESCDKGYRGFPSCELCPCKLAGTKDSACDGNCVCKENVVGDRCDTCKAGYFDLSEKNEEGCIQCFCYGRSVKCKSYEMSLESILTMRGWKVTNIQGTRVVEHVEIRESQESQEIVIANEEMTQYQSYYWLAPPEYLGEKLTGYGGRLQFKSKWVTARGDVAGHPTKGPNCIIEGDGFLIGCSDVRYPHINEATLTCPLTVGSWYHIPRTVYDIVRHGGSSYKGEKVTRWQLMRILGKIERVMLRAKFHTEQIESSLQEAHMYIGSDNSLSVERITSVEQCDCPVGYGGLSCQVCAYGYVRVNDSCVACDCNSHAASCNPVTGECVSCDHNTRGDKCQLCSYGYYGDATRGTPNDCKRCACPLVDPSNNFSPSCTAAAEGDDYVCDECEEGYTGQYCDRCDDGWYGNPLHYNSFCRPCNCNGNPCNHLTGECQCTHNTAGPRCDRCSEGYFASSVRNGCDPCNCDLYGSVNQICDATTGQCNCKPNYQGQRCDRCENHLGNVASGCRECRCDPIGSLGQECDPISGQCSCKPGVFGLRCDACLDGYYNMTNDGCQWCGCDPRGSVDPRCNVLSGQCTCRIYVVGQTCDVCQYGYWNLNKGGCQPCDCNTPGSLNGSCSLVTGSCFCKPGVGGERCDQCLPGYFGFTDSGCRECEPCDRPGHICDPDTGRCVCPSLTAGPSCSRCLPNAFGYDPIHGCKPCRCHSQGSRGSSCDPSTGQCNCLKGFEGQRCDHCQFGYFSFPSCRPCHCHVDGTVSSSCRADGKCQCNEQGQCPCKSNVAGVKCGRCKHHTFGLDASNPSGCSHCFCFGRSKQCEVSSFFWGQLALPGSRASVSIMPDGTTQFNTTNGLPVIPQFSPSFTVGVSYPFNTPIYWELPEDFLGDKTLSYGGYLSFQVTSEGGRSRFPDRILSTYPLVQIQGNNRLILEYFPDSINPSGVYRVRLHEGGWRLKNSLELTVTRAMMMVALQNLQHVLIRASNSADTSKATLSALELQVAQQGILGSPASSIEVCECPPSFGGNSCQNPAIGYCRYKRPDYLNSRDITQLIGEVRNCKCNGHSSVCDLETCACQDCQHNTFGPFCQDCKPGYYGDPTQGGCEICTCSRFSDSCYTDSAGNMRCACKEGYAGTRCDGCANGYYGSPRRLGWCRPCQCDPHGSLTQSCDRDSGQCVCKSGITGRDCSQCAPRHIITETGCESCEHGCTGILFETLDLMMELLWRVNWTSTVPPPWTQLYKIENRTISLEVELQAWRNLTTFLSDLNIDLDLLPNAEDAIRKAKQIEMSAQERAEEARKWKTEIQLQLTLIQQQKDIIQDIITHLRNYALGETPSINVERALQEAENYLRILNEKDFSIYRTKCELELQAAMDLLLKVRSLLFDSSVLNGTWSRIHSLENLLTDLSSYVADSERMMNKTFHFGIDNKIMLDAITANLRELRSLLRMGENLNDESTNLLQLSIEIYEKARITFQTLEILLDNSDEPIQLLKEKEGILARLNPEYHDKYFLRVQAHVESLVIQAKKLVKLFKETEDVAKPSLEAAQAYQNIVDAIHEAREAALEANRTAYSIGRESLVQEARQSRELSKETQLQSQTLFSSLAEMTSTLEAEKRKLLILERHISEKHEFLTEANRDLDLLRTDIGTRARNAAESSMASLVESESVIDRVETIQHQIDTILRPKLASLQGDTLIDKNSVEQRIREAKKHTADSGELILTYQLRNENITRQHNLMEEDLKQLQRRIQRARNTAATIRVSLSGATRRCEREYVLKTEPTTKNEIRLLYGVGQNDSNNALLFYVKPTIEAPDFMALELVRGKVRYLWNSGGNTTSMTNDLRLRHLRNDEDKSWYSIVASRTGSTGRLIVRNKKTNENLEKTKTGDWRYDIMNGGAETRVFIGHVPDQFRAPQLRSRSFSGFGCLFEATLDEKTIGLWNFRKGRGCTGCVEGPREPTENSIFFTGTGYSVLDQIQRYPGTVFSLQMHIRTFDKDALLFLSANTETDHYFIVDLHGGKIRLRIYYGKSAQLEITSLDRYNNGEWIVIGATRLTIGRTETGTLSIQVDGEEIEKINGFPSSVAYINHLNPLELQNSKNYFGGVPPDYERPDWPQITFRSLLGCIKEVNINGGAQNLLAGDTFGIEPKCQLEGLRYMGFKDDGFAQFRTKSLLQETSSLSVTFRTKQANALLLLFTSGKQGETYYSVSLVDGTLQFLLKSNGNSEILLSSETYNDGHFHVLTIKKSENRMSLHMDDKKESELNLALGNNYDTSRGNMYIGGLPLNLRRRLEINSFFKGCIRDLIIKNQVMNFEDGQLYDNALVGRCEDENAIKSNHAPRPSDQPSPTSCADLSQYNLDTKAVKFGDIKHSHIRLSIKKKDFKRDFRISLRLRTYYTSGLVFFIQHRKKKHFFFAGILKNGRLKLIIQKNRQRTITSRQQLNDGQWKRIAIVKHGKKVTLEIDGQRKKKGKIGKKFSASSYLYIGGLTSNGLQLPQDFVKESFKGCIKDLSINGKHYNLAGSADILHEVGQCFVSVEPGSYFNRDAYATYDDTFKVGAQMDIELEFRTTESTGILLSVAKRSSSPALALELYQGNVRLSVDRGDGKIFYAEEKYQNPWYLCDNKWHSVKALYETTAVTLWVDRGVQKYGFKKNGFPQDAKASSPLYIGGLPVSADVGVLQTRENFKGCIRNIVINKRKRDWTDMASLQHVLLNSCPTV